MVSRTMQIAKYARQNDGQRKFESLPCGGYTGGLLASSLRKLDSLEDLGLGTVKTPIPRVSSKEGREVQSIWNRVKAKDRKNLPEEELDVSQIKTGQGSVQKNGVERIIYSGNYSNGSSNDLPIVVRYNGNNVLVDGNHRVAAALLTGTKKMKVKVFTR